MNFSNIWQHPKTTIIGFLTALVTISTVLSQQGVTLGHVGTGTVVELVSAIAAALALGFAQDWQGAPKTAKTNAPQKLGVALLIILLLPTPFVTGCTSSQVNSVVSKINAFLPTAVSLLNEALTIYAAVGSTPQNAGQSQVYSALQIVETDLTALQKPLADYLAASASAQKQSAWTNVMAAVDTATTDADSLLQIAAVKDPESSKNGAIIVASIDAAVHVLDGYVSSTLTPAQVQARASARRLKLQSLVTHWSSQDRQMVSAKLGVPFGVALRNAEAAGF